MSRRFYLIWLIVAAILFGVVTLGAAALSQMGLSTTGYVPPVPWPWVLGSAFGITAYWTAFCWCVGLSGRKPLFALGIAVVTASIAYDFPIWDQARYDEQRDEIAQSAVVSVAPYWGDKTALLIWPHSQDCLYNCWNLSLHMQARVVNLMGEDARAVDFSQAVDLTQLPLQEMFYPDGDQSLSDEIRPAGDVTIDYVILQMASARDYDGVFDGLRPSGIPADGLHIDAMIVPVEDQAAFSLGDAVPLLRLSHVSRTTAQVPYLPFNGRVRYWNHTDRLANWDTARGYFCSAASRDQHWCNNAFD